jgi:molybdate transport system ATP-binding protein
VSLDADIGVELGTLDERVALYVGDGEVVAVLGPNGSGKTVMLRALAGLQPLTSGRIELDGAVLDDPAAGVLVAPERRRCALVFQDYLLFPHLTVQANVAFGLRARGVGKREADARAVEWLGRLELSDVASLRPGALSGGQAQRVALARALATEPRLLLLDEPMAALDAGVRTSVRQLLRQHLREFQGAAILVTHDALDAATVADRLVVLERGRVTQQGTLAEISVRPHSAYVAELLGLNLLEGRVVGDHVELGDGLSVVTAGAVETGPAGEVLVVVAPSAIALFGDAPHGSPRNTWATSVTELHLLGERVRVRLGEPLALTAEVTPAAVAELGLHEGGPVWAAVKATQIAAYPAGRVT